LVLTARLVRAFFLLCTLALALLRLGYTQAGLVEETAMDELGRTLLGIGSDELALWQVVLRATVVYLLALGLIKIGDKRFIGQSTSIDLIIAIVLGNILAYAIIGAEAGMGTALTAAASLVLLHWLMGMLACRSAWLDEFLKGKPHVLVESGEVNWDNMRRTRISMEDLNMALHLGGQLNKVEQVELARFERNGEISLVPRRQQAKVVEVAVGEGVQVVRIEIGDGGGAAGDQQKPF
jgi:uncharacterized membrane protein YcaP (DUF421 family)